MAYEKQNFIDGQVLTAEHLNHIEDGIAGLEGGYVAPSAKVVQTSDGAKITITDKSGTTTATITNGKDGAKGDSVKGDPGEDGVSPTVAVSKSGKVTTISITDKNGTKTATAKHTVLRSKTVPQNAPGRIKGESRTSPILLPSWE